MFRKYLTFYHYLYLEYEFDSGNKKCGTTWGNTYNTFVDAQNACSSNPKCTAFCEDPCGSRNYEISETGFRGPQGRCENVWKKGNLIIILYL